MLRWICWWLAPAQRGWRPPSLPHCTVHACWWRRKSRLSAAPAPGPAAGCGSRKTPLPARKGLLKTTPHRWPICRRKWAVWPPTHACAPFYVTARRWWSSSARTRRYSSSPAVKCRTSTTATVLPPAGDPSRLNPMTPVGWAIGCTACGRRWKPLVWREWELRGAQIWPTSLTPPAHRVQRCMLPAA